MKITPGKLLTLRAKLQSLEHPKALPGMIKAINKKLYLEKLEPKVFVVKSSELDLPLAEIPIYQIIQKRGTIIFIEDEFKNREEIKLEEDLFKLLVL
jgi:hypothetical protein